MSLGFPQSPAAHTGGPMSRTFALPTGVPAGRRVAVIGDVHGEAARFSRALDAIGDPAHTTLILLGDLIDRGPDSAGCLALARGTETRFAGTIILPGNHEQMAWLASRQPRSSWMDVFVQNGGDATLAAFDGSPDALLAAFPTQVVDRLEGRKPVWHREGGLLFVHAGVNPALDTEMFLSAPCDPECPPRWMTEDLSPLWVRRPFYGVPGPYAAPGGDPVMVVYGHTRIGSWDPGVILERIADDLGSWRLPLDGTSSGFLPVAEIFGAEARITLIP